MADRTALRGGVGAAAVTCAAGAALWTGFGIVVVAATAVVAVIALIAFVRTSVLHGALTRRLRDRSAPAEIAGTRVRVGPIGGAVFVAGLARPDIFCDGTLLEDLDDAEIRAVTLHERAHQLARDPLRNAAVAAVAPLLRRLDDGRAWLERRAAAREIAADRYALGQGANRAAIASALLKVPPAGAVHAAAFAPAVELRLRALLGDDVEIRGRRRWVAITAGAVAGAVVCLAMLHPATAVLGMAPACC